MLRPQEIERLPEAMLALYAEVEQDILADMARRISTYNYWIPAADHQYRRLIEMGNFHSYVMTALSSRTGKTQNELARLMQQAGSKALAFDTRIYQQHGLKPPPLAASPALQKILNTGLAQTNGLFRNLTGTTASTATGQFAHALDRAWLQIQSGAFDRKTAVQMAVKDLAKQGVGAIRYPSGKADTLEVAVRRAVVTGVNQTALKMQWQLADEMGCDLVEVTAHAGARPEHAAWQGGIYSRSGQSTKYPDFVFSTGYGSGAGLGGWNCRHSFFPYFEGSPRAYSPEMLEEYEQKTRKYNGKALTEYEATQQQRHMERQIRRWKREHAAMQAAGQDTAEAAAKLRKWQDAQRDFIRQTGLKRQSDREQIAGVAGARKPSPRAAKSIPSIAKPLKSGIIKSRDQKMNVGLQFFATPSFSRHTDAALKKSIRSLEARVEEHKMKIINPVVFYPEWDKLDSREQEGSIRHWEKEIKTFEAQIQAAREEAERRGL